MNKLLLVSLFLTCQTICNMSLASQAAPGQTTSNKSLSMSVVIPQIPQNWKFDFGHSRGAKTFGEMKLVAVNADNPKEVSEIGKVNSELFKQGNATDRFGGTQGKPNWTVPNWKKAIFQIKYGIISIYGSPPNNIAQRVAQCGALTKDAISKLQAVRTILKLTPS